MTTPLIAVCMATHEPDRTLLERQVESLRAQHHTRFVCLVCDDASSTAALDAIHHICAGDDRFVVCENGERLGFYRNFERALRLVREDAEYVALCDQDDVWLPAKLTTLLDALHDSDALLAYGDMTIETADGRRLADSYWTDRRNNSSRLGSLLLVNTVSGAASLFRRRLLDDALPFPRVRASAYHDHWLACTALALGDIDFVDRPLQAYVQHAGNIVGRRRDASGDLRGGLVHAARRFARHPRSRLRATLFNARRYYEDDVLVRQTFASELQCRLEGRMSPHKAHDVACVAGLPSSLRSFLWLLARSASDVRGESETLGIENQLLKGTLWHHLQRFKAWPRHRP